MSGSDSSVTRGDEICPEDVAGCFSVLSWDRAGGEEVAFGGRLYLFNGGGSSGGGG